MSYASRAAVSLALVACGARTDLGSSAQPDAAVDASAFEASADAPPDVIEAGQPVCVATAPTRLADAQPGIDQVGLDDTSVYFHDQDGLWRAPKSGGAAVNLAPLKTYNWPDIAAFAADDAGVTYWQPFPQQKDTHTDISHIDPGSTTATLVASVPRALYYGRADHAHDAFIVGVDFGAQTTAFVDEVTPNGIVTELFATSGGLGFARSDDQDLYVAQNASVIRVSNQKTSVVGSVDLTLYVVALVFDQDTIYLIADDASENAIVASLPKAGGKPTTLWSGSGIAVGGMDQDANYIYFVDRFQPAIMRTKKDGSGTSAFVTGTHDTQSFIDVKVDDRCVYWSLGEGEGSKNGIFAAPK